MKEWALPGLVLIAVLQLVALGYRTGDAAMDASRWIAAGDEVLELGLADGSGTRRSLATGQPTLVLAFHSQCAHCERIAPTWSAWLDRHRGDVNVIAVSKEPHSSAKSYADRHGWDVDILTTGETSPGSREHAFTSRTPWVFALDSGARVIDEGHGSLINEIGRLVLSQGASEPFSH